MATYQDFKNSVLGTTQDVDNYYGAQCPIKGTMVLKANGYYTPVEELQIGDVLHGGNVVVSNNRKKSDIIHVETDLGHLYVSPTHRFIMADGSEKKANELELKDWIDLDVAYNEVIQSFPKLNMTVDEFKFFGIWLADGTKKYRLENSTQPEIFVTVGTEAKREFIKSLNLEITEHQHSNGKASVFYLKSKSHKELASLIHETKGKCPRDRFSVDEYKWIIEGYCKGDGTTKNNSTICTSVDKALLLFIQKGCILNGYRAKLSNPIKRESTNLCDNPKDLYRLTINRNKEPKGEVLNIENSDKDEIYILNVDGNHTYYAENHHYHNCWDGYAYYCKWLGVPYANCTVSGYVKDIWEQRYSNGILNYFDEVSVMQAGDVAVFKEVGGWTPYSHIAIFDSDIDGTYGYFLGQNQGGANGAYNLCKLPYSATYDTAFRPKAFSGGSSSSSSSTSSSFSTDQLIEEHAKATFTVDGVNARVNSPTSDWICRQYNTGDTVEYTYKWIGNGHRYICWYEAENLIMCAVSAGEDYNSERWATFSAIEESKTDSVPNNTDSKDSGQSTTTVDTNGFSGVEEGQVEQADLADETLQNDFVKVDLISKDLYSYKCPYVMTPKTVVIHNAGTKNGTASNLNKALHNTKEYKSWHFSVDDKEVIESLPLNRNAFATGDGGYGIGNRTGIQIEIAKDMDTDTEEEWQQARKNGAKLTAILLKKYGWTIDNVSKHQDYKMTDGTYKYCPHKILDEGWDDFKKLIQSELDSLGKTTDDSQKSETDVEKDDKNTETNDTIKETNSLLKMLIELLKKIFNIK